MRTKKQRAHSIQSKSLPRPSKSVFSPAASHLHTVGANGTREVDGGQHGAPLPLHALLARTVYRLRIIEHQLGCRAQESASPGRVEDEAQTDRHAPRAVVSVV